MATCSNPNDVSYFRFPRDPELQREWCIKCKRQDVINTKNARICELHFTADCFERDLKNELLGLPPRKRLKKMSVPTLLDLNQKNTGATDRDARHSRRQQSRERSAILSSILGPFATERNNNMVDQLPAPNQGAMSSRTDNTVQCNSGASHAVPDNDAEDRQPLAVPDKDAEDRQLLAVHGNDREDKGTQCNTLYLSQLQMKIRRLELSLKNEKRKVSSLRKEIQRRDSKKYQQDMLKQRLQTFQTNAQVRQTLNEKSKFARGYSSEDIIRALVIRSMSSRTFEYLRKNKFLSLPCRQTLEKFLHSIKCEPGILHSSINILMKKVEVASSPHEHLAVLCFDEMDVRKCFEWCPKQKRIYGPHKKFQVVQVRGLTHAWKQPVYANFDTTMSKELLEEIIVKLETSGLKILGIAFDMGNTKIISELQLTPENSSFKNPAAPECRVFAFPDVPHLLKLFRNHLLDEGYNFMDAAGNYFPLGKSDFESLLLSDSYELKIAFKISDIHIHCKGSARQRVRTAAQLLSLTTAKALTYIKGDSFKTQSEAIQTVNNWFDVMNANKVKDKKKLACGFGIHYEDQLHALDKMEDMVNSMKISGASSLLPFQKGILMSIKSVKDLLAEMKSLGLYFLLTTHVNQDSVENLFSQLRAITGNNQHPSPVECLRRLRILMLGKNPDISLQHPSVEPEAETYKDLSTETECVSKLLTVDLEDIPVPAQDVIEDDLPQEIVA